MKTYRNTETGNVYTEEELFRLYEQFKHEIYADAPNEAPAFDDYIDEVQASGGLTTVWYAVMRDREDDDWGTGSYDLDDAKRMCVSIGAGAYIAVIDEAPNPVCIEEIEQDEF